MSTILVVEDEVRIAELIAMLVEDEGHSVVLAGNGREALDLLSALRPDLIICDLMMPIMDGWTFLATIWKETAFRAIPVIVTSAAHRAAVPTGGERVVFVAKPFSLEGLAETITRMLREPE